MPCGTIVGCASPSLTALHLNISYLTYKMYKQMMKV